MATLFTTSKNRLKQLQQQVCHCLTTWDNDIENGTLAYRSTVNDAFTVRQWEPNWNLTQQYCGLKQKLSSPETLICEGWTEPSVLSPVVMLSLYACSCIPFKKYLLFLKLSSGEEHSPDWEIIWVVTTVAQRYEPLKSLGRHKGSVPTGY